MLTAEQKIKTLNQILSVGACAAPPPVMGWLVESGIFAPGGFDMDRARAELEKLTSPDPKKAS